MWNLKKENYQIVKQKSFQQLNSKRITMMIYYEKI